MKQALNDETFMDQLIQLFRQEGFRHFTIGDMAARLHCSRRRLYAVAESKEALFRVVVERSLSDQLAQGERVTRDETDLAVAIAAYLEVGVRGSHGVNPLWVADVDADEDTRAVFDAYQRARASRIADLINEGVRQGVFTPCHGRVIAECMLQASMRLRQPDFLNEAGVTLEEAFAEFYRVTLNGLLVDKRDQFSKKRPQRPSGKDAQCA